MAIEFNREKHWDHVYQIRSAEELSWYQPYPEISMRFIEQYGSGSDAHVIDIGSGTGSIVKVLVEKGYHHITALDISESALIQAKKRMGDIGKAVKWHHADVLEFHPKEKYDIWHDRAAFHFLTDPKEVDTYVAIAATALQENGLLILATFSEKGPDSCSNLPVQRYSQDELSDLLKVYFTRLECVNSDHITPRETLQNFTFCAFRRNHTDCSIS